MLFVYLSVYLFFYPQIADHLDYRSNKVKRRTGNAKSVEQRKKWGDTS